MAKSSEGLAGFVVVMLFVVWFDMLPTKTNITLNKAWYSVRYQALYRKSLPTATGATRL